jgi:phenylacetate-CoA ligase
MSEAAIPYYWRSVDWVKLERDFPPPPNYTGFAGRRSADELRAFQNTLFMARIAEGWRTPFYQKLWGGAGLEAGDVRSLDDIAKLPCFTSDDLKQAALDSPPFGSQTPPHLIVPGPMKIQTSGGTTGMPRITPFDPIAWEIQAIQAARGLYAQGMRPGDVVQILFTTALSNGGWSVNQAALNWLGCTSVTSGSGVITPSERQLELALALGTNVWFGTAEYLGRLAEVAAKIGFPLRSLPTKFLTGIIGTDTDGLVRQRLEEAWGAPFYDIWGTHEHGYVAFECPHKTGKHVSEDTCYLEIVDLDDGSLLGFGEEGNIVATALARSVPLFIRYNLRDRMKLFDRTPCACGLDTQTLSLFLGRSDEMVKLRGTNVYPMACLSVVSRDDRITDDYICVVYSVGEGLGVRDEMTIRVERKSVDWDKAELSEELAEVFRQALGVKVAVEIHEAGDLAEQTRLGAEGKPRRLMDLRKSA